MGEPICSDHLPLSIVLCLPNPPIEDHYLRRPKLILTKFDKAVFANLVDSRMASLQHEFNNGMNRFACWYWAVMHSCCEVGARCVGDLSNILGYSHCSGSIDILRVESSKSYNRYPSKPRWNDECKKAVNTRSITYKKTKNLNLQNLKAYERSLMKPIK